MDTIGKRLGFGRNESYDDAVRAYEAGEFEAAIELFKACLSGDPDVSTLEQARSGMAGAYGKLARRAVEQRHWDHALNYLDDAIALRPRFADLRMLRAQVFESLNRTEDRMLEIRFALDMNPRYGFAVLHDGILKYEEGERAEGIERIWDSVKCDPQLKTETFDNAMSLHGKGEHVRALEMFKDVRPVQQTDPEVIVREADGYAHEGRWRDAEESYRRALDVAPKFADVRCKHGQALLELDEVEQAIAEFREAVSINDRYADGYAYLGIGLRSAGLEPEALDAFRAALEVDPEHAVAKAEVERTS
ncbi:MAG: tetratricopeptide repeat protein [Armatimonadetes bacterium]|nr:tetratricopeptide repeat protein [Armatimonadota bacterium]